MKSTPAVLPVMLLFLLGLPRMADRAFAAEAADDTATRQTVRVLLERHCLDCHDPATQEGGLDLHNADLATESRDALQLWSRVFDRVQQGEMPPTDYASLPTDDKRQLLTALGRSITATETALHQAEGRSAWRRLNRVEYQNTVRDLLHVDLDVKEMLPEDGSRGGFDTVDEALDVSAVLIEKYLEAADALLDAAIVHTPRPETKTQRLLYSQDQGALGRAIGTQILALNDAVVFTNESYPPKILNLDRAPAAGRYRYRLSAFAWNSAGRTVPILIYAGSQNPQRGKTELTQMFDAPPDRATVFEWVERLDAGDRIRIVTQGPNKPWPDKPGDYHGPGLAVQWLEIQGPLVDRWPPRSHTELLGDVDLQAGTLADAEAVLRRFVPRAFRRPIADHELEPFLQLVQARQAAGLPFEDALRVGLKAVLVSPQFLYLTARPGRLDPYQLAARLSYFLWSTMPDEPLLQLAATDRLQQPPVLRDQVERMLNDPRAAAFTENFTGQWLRLRELRATNPDKELYPEFDALLERSMLLETRAFFQEILQHDLSVTNFIDSDFAMWNQRLAEHYGVPEVQGMQIRRVTLPPDARRGGVLTHASVLKVTANGTNTSPVLRGVWVLDRLLGQPAPPPPKNVPAIEPDIRGATTIREQLEKHRSIASCAVCHRKIDPPGYALECFDVIGGYRERYRVKADWNDRKITPDGQRLPYGDGPAVQCGDTLPDGRAFRGVDEFQQLILEDPEQIVRAVAGKLLVYATGHAIEFRDRQAIQRMVTCTRAADYGLRSVIHELVQSETFQSK
jgi:mono/diheme cytochrome c family protein